MDTTEKVSQPFIRLIYRNGVIYKDASQPKKEPIPYSPFRTETKTEEKNMKV